jgi:glutaredoxin
VSPSFFAADPRRLEPPGGQSPPSAATVGGIASVVLYHAAGCHLCEKARGVLRAELGDAFDEVDIGGDDDLEARYREWLPVVEIDGERAFVYFVDPVALRRKLAQSRA